MNKEGQNCTLSRKSAPAVISAESGLTPLQEKGAIMLASGVRITEVAKALGASRNTIYKWLSSPAFVCYCNLMKQDIKNYVEGSLLELHTRAIEGLKDSIASENEAIKMRASMWVIERISQMNVGATNVRQVLLESSEHNPDWGRDERYQRALEEAGLE